MHPSIHPIGEAARVYPLDEPPRVHAPEVRGVAEHTNDPPTQLIVPEFTHVPVPPDEHPAPPPGLPSSTVPLQLSSMPLQVSVVEASVCVQLSTPAPVQAYVPAEQRPASPVTHAPVVVVVV